MEKVNSDDISFSVKLTHELDDNEIVELSDLYNKVFKSYIKTLRNHEDFMKKFTSNTKKYSFHGLMKKNNKVIGSYSVIPNKFRYFDEDLFFGLGINTMIEQNYRGNLDHFLYRDGHYLKGGKLSRSIRFLDNFFPIHTKKTYPMPEDQKLRDIPAGFFLRPYQGNPRVLKFLKFKNICFLPNIIIVTTRMKS